MTSSSRLLLFPLAALLSVPSLPAHAEAPRAAPGPVATRAAAPDRWGPLRTLLGTWETTSRGSPGSGTGRREYRLVLGDRFIEVRNTATYPPQEKNPKGEVHEDVGYVSLDRARRAYVLRQFHVEGFVNTYAAPADAGANEPIVFTSEAIENIPPGWRARETYRPVAEGEIVERFELAAPGKDFEVYTETRLKRVR